MENVRKTWGGFTHTVQYNAQYCGGVYWVLRSCLNGDMVITVRIKTVLNHDDPMIRCTNRGHMEGAVTDGVHCTLQTHHCNDEGVSDESTQSASMDAGELWSYRTFSHSLRLAVQGRNDGGIWVYIPPKIYTPQNKFLTTPLLPYKSVRHFEVQ